MQNPWSVRKKLKGSFTKVGRILHNRDLFAVIPRVLSNGYVKEPKLSMRSLAIAEIFVLFPVPEGLRQS
jgi:hypothetical protein